MEPFDFPIIRFDEQCYLEKLQTGSLYMRNLFCYQVEESDASRYDKFDGAIPIEVRSELMNNHSIDNFRIMKLQCYIKCFFQFLYDDLHQDDNGEYRLIIKEKSKHWIKSLNVKYGMVLNTKMFLERFYAKCDKINLRCGAGQVKYMSSDAYNNYLMKLSSTIKELSNNKSKDLKSIDLPRPEFCKKEILAMQQELRICVYDNDFNQKLINSYAPISYIPEDDSQKIFSRPYSLEIGSLEDISVIIPIEDIFKNGIPTGIT